MDTERRIHWKAPTVMVSEFLAGAVFALGHHFFYRSLINEVASAKLYNIAGISVSQQQVNFAAGIAFAFVVKSCLVAAVSIAYAQIFWKSCLGQPIRLSTVDVGLSSFGNPAALLNMKAWLKFPLLFCLAIVAWLLPIASIISPAALTVVPKLTTTSSMLHVPNLDWNNLNFVASMIRRWDLVTGSGDVGYYQYNGPQYTVKQLAEATAIQGSLLQIPASDPNSTWTLNLIAPSLQCSNVTGPLRIAIERNIIAASVSCTAPYGYVSWTPSMEDGMPFARGGRLQSASLNPTQSMSEARYLRAVANLSDSVTIATNSSAVATIYVALFSQVVGPTGASCGDSQIAESTILQCSLYNSSRTLGFRYVNGVQQISLNNLEVFEKDPILALGGVYGPGHTSNCTTLNARGDTCRFDTSTARTLAYQAIMDSFGQLLKGSVRWIPIRFHPNQSTAQDATTTITHTIFSDSPPKHSATSSSFMPKSTSIVSYGWQDVEVHTSMTSTSLLGLDAFRFLRDSISSATHGDLRHSLTRVPTFKSNEIDDPSTSTSTSGLSLKAALEQLFDNITISLMSSSLLQPEYSDSKGAPRANVTLTTYQNVYHYTPFKLWLAYGISIFSTGLVTSIGVFAILNNGASYSSSLSTILRTTREAQVSVALSPQDLDGRDPLPQRLRNAYITLGNSSSGQRGEVEYSKIDQSPEHSG